MARATFYFTAEDGRDPIVFEEAHMLSKWYARAKALLANPTVRPFEVWAVRAAVVYTAAKFGVSLAK